ncbi:hypothetical protein ABFS83_04G172900 [Erythranthe nasuta]
MTGYCCLFLVKNPNYFNFPSISLLSPLFSLQSSLFISFISLICLSFSPSLHFSIPQRTLYFLCSYYFLWRCYSYLSPPSVDAASLHRRNQQRISLRRWLLQQPSAQPPPVVVPNRRPPTTLPHSIGETEKGLACGCCNNHHQPNHCRTGESKHEGNKPIVALITIPTLLHPIMPLHHLNLAASPSLHDLNLTASSSPAYDAVTISVFGWIGVWVGFGRG